MLSYSRSNEKVFALIETIKDVDAVKDLPVEDLKKCTPYHIVNIFLKTHHKSIKQLYDIIVSCIGTQNAKELPLLLPVKGSHTELYVYQNIKVNIDEIYKYTNFHYHAVSCWPVSGEILKQWSEDMANEKTKKRWETFGRAYKAVMRRDKVRIGQILARYTTLKNSYTDDKIQAFADKISSSLKPIELIWTSTPEDWATMYGSGPTSCMTKSNWDGLSEVGIIPPSMYHFIPECRGVYIYRNGKVAARTVTYGKEYGRVYSTSTEMTRKLTEELKKQGYKARHGSYWQLPEFKVPGFYVKSIKDYVCPIPYFDDFTASGLYQRFDIPTKTFVFTKDRTDHKFGATSNTYMIKAKSIVTASRCYVCGASTRSADYADGKLVCSERCASELGYVYAYQSDGNLVLRHMDEALYNVSFGRYYTTIHAMEYLAGCNVAPVLTFRNIKFIEDGTLTKETIFREFDAVGPESYKYIFNGVVLVSRYLRDDIFKLAKNEDGSYAILGFVDESSNVVVDW